MKTLGIDIGGSSIKLALLDGGEAIWTAQSRSYSRPDTSSLINTLRDAATGRPGGATRAGLCVPGLLDPVTRRIVQSVNLPCLTELPLDELLRRAFPGETLELLIANDAVAAGVDVTSTLALEGRSLVLALGTGVGAAVLDDGKPLIVEGDSPGHIGQVDVSLTDAPPIGPDGGAGSLEAYMGVPALVRQYGQMERFFAAASVDDASLRALTRAIRIGHAIYRPNHVVLVGGVGIRLRDRIQPLKAAIDRHLTSIAREDWTLHCGHHDFHAAQGAARIAARSGSLRA